MRRATNYQLQTTTYKLLTTNSSFQRGVAALLIIVLVASAVLLMALNSSSLGLGELELGYASQRGAEAFGVADGCMEETFRQIRLNTSYGIGAGSINVSSVSNGSCIIEVTDLGSNRRRVQVTGQSSDYYKKIEAELTLLSGNVISLDSFKELENW